MKKTILATALMLAITSVSAEEGFKNDFKVVGNSLIKTEEFNIEHFKKIEDAVKSIASYYKQAGYVGINVTADKADGMIYVNERVSNIQGVYASFLNDGEVLNKQDLQNSLLIRRSLDENEKVLVKVESSNDESLKISAEGKEDENAKKVGGAIEFNSYGGRYSGSGVTTGSVWARDHGWRFDGSLSSGIEGVDINNDEDADGGHYHAGSAKVSRAFPFGIVEAAISHSDYKQGGELLQYGMTGGITKMHVDVSKPSFMGYAGVTAHAKVERLIERQNLETFDLEEKRTTDLIGVGVNKTFQVGKATISASVDVEQAIAASQDYNVIPLIGEFSDHWIKGNINITATGGINHKHITGWSIASEIQRATDDLTSAKEFAIGGSMRGSSSRAGEAGVGVNGASLAARLHQKPITTEQGLTFKNYVGVNGGWVEDRLGNESDVSSFEVGTDIELIESNKNIRGGVSYSVSLDDGEGRFGLFFKMNF